MVGRLTYKVNDAYYVKEARHLYEDFNELVGKLGQYENIEEELGISLPILFKALKDGFYIKHNFEIVHIYPDKNITINFWYKTINVFIPPKFFIDCNKGESYLSEEIEEEYWFKDYGKTWWLKEDLKSE